MTALPPVTELLASAVSALGGRHRDGQLAMASAVANAIDTGEHLAVQAGTGTGKSLAYLVPALRHAVESGSTVVVSTATIALQRQLIDRDLPRLATALRKPLGREPSFAILKGRANYICLNKIHSGEAEEQTEELFDPFTTSRVGREVVRLREWVSDTESGDRDDLPTAVMDRSWRQVSVTARECLGAANCSYGTDCFAELARGRSSAADVVVTNHAMLAIDAMSGFNVLPEHDVVIVDEAHELVDRITSVATAEIASSTVAGVARRCSKLIDEELVDDIHGAGELVAALLESTAPGRWTSLPDGAGATFAALRDRLWRARSAIGPARDGTDSTGAAARSAAITALDDLHDNAVRLLGAFDEPDESKRRDVVWIAEDLVRDERRRTLRIAPLSVGGLLRSSLFAEATAVLTSATLTVGGTFDSLAANWGLPISGRGADASAAVLSDLTATGTPTPADGDTIRWQGLDVGSPFDYRRCAILYVAAHLDPPGRASIAEATLDEMVQLITAAGGRTLGLFSSMRAAKEAAAAVRTRIDTPILCQGENATGTLIEQFAADEATCLFGTLSLWQGVDVPGPSLSLVLIDRVPFPRPDDPLLIARQSAVAARGGNGFLAVAANHAALLLAQGAGRLLRATDDRGVVAILDPRLVTARYGGYLRASLPPFWQTTDPAVVRAALTRLQSEPTTAG
ncbi:MAG: ATP-dependent DNA helicase [Corynebacteriales bacterium]|uniref:ATP-dependent helicase DinG n=1 Tax=Williamsia herbipolensis TaxID=1603258 RepID=A0AAU4K2L5_9NOCA|nr:ATP-dependent DNA helicase [Williamsia herbipolensis]MCX6467740.1 ATP-dependent DNA helicase [Mycobacteriales bacterium]